MRIYADEEERKQMEVCHPYCIKYLKELLDSIEDHSKLRAIDVAGGDGRLSETLLTGIYDRVDLFDQC